MLANFIISQQLSTKAAAAIKQRLALSLTAPFAPETFLLLSGDQLRGAGLSQAKVRYITVLATNICERRLVFEEILRQDDEAVIRALSVCPGIGRWTAEMFLIFGLKRLDVLALGDAGLQRVCCMEKEVGGKICCRTWPRRGDPIAPWPRGICGDRWSSCDYLDAPELHTSLISSELAIRP